MKRQQKMISRNFGGQQKSFSFACKRETIIQTVFQWRCECYHVLDKPMTDRSGKRPWKGIHICRTF